MKKVNVALVGATGMVGRTFIKVLEERNFPIDKIYMFSSAKSAGTVVKFADQDIVVEELNEKSFDTSNCLPISCSAISTCFSKSVENGFAFIFEYIFLTDSSNG